MSSSTASATTGMKGKKPSIEIATSNPSLPEDLVVSCLARVSRLYYPTLSLVSKSFRSLIASPDLYKTRSLLGRTESCLYLCLRYSPEDNPRWFTLCRKPNRRTLSKEKNESSGNLLVPIPIINSPPLEWSNIVAVGSHLYAINGPIEDAPCSNVSFLDCRSHTWLEAPSMRVAHTNSQLDGKMYLAGSSENVDSLNCIQVFSTKTQTWKPVPFQKRIFGVGDLEGKIYTICRTECGQGVTIKPKDLTCDVVGFCGEKDWSSVCMIGNIVYYYRPSGEFLWIYSGKGESARRNLRGLEGLPKFDDYASVKLADYDGKLMVLWDTYVPESESKEKMIWCAEISLQKKCNNEEIWGTVEWFDAVLTVPEDCKFVRAIAATV
ncbi:putative F-box/kelch-repeat protein [Arabidopsis thaliana]